MTKRTKIIVAAIVSAIVGGALYRWRGMASAYKKYFPRPFNQIAYSLPYAVYAWVITGQWWVGLAVLAATTAMVLKGHGQYFLDLVAKYIVPETLDFLLAPFFGKDPRTEKLPPFAPLSEEVAYNQWIDIYGRKKLYRRSVAGLTYMGILMTLPAGIVTLDPIVALSGAVKGPAYLIAHKLGWGTDGGEILTGAFMYPILTIRAMYVIL